MFTCRRPRALCTCARATLRTLGTHARAVCGKHACIVMAAIRVSLCIHPYVHAMHHGQDVCMRARKACYICTRALCTLCSRARTLRTLYMPARTVHTCITTADTIGRGYQTRIARAAVGRVQTPRMCVCVCGGGFKTNQPWEGEGNRN